MTSVNDVHPFSTANNTTNLCLRYSVISPQNLLAYAPLVIAATYFNNLCFGQFRAAAFCATSATALTLHIVHIVLTRTKEKVVRSDASAHVAGMANVLVVSYWAMREFVGRARGNNGSHCSVFVVSLHVGVAIAAAYAASRPQPTFVSLYHFRPESFRKQLPASDTRTCVAAIRRRLMAPFKCSADIALVGCEMSAANITRAVELFGRVGVKIRTHFGTSNQVSGCHGVGRVQRRGPILFGPIVALNA